MTPDDVRQVLQDGAARPNRPVDTGQIMRKGRALQRVRVASTSALAIVAVAGIAFAAANLDSRASEGRGRRPVRPAAIPEGWTELPAPPESRDGMSTVWAGTRLLAWGGCDPSEERGCEPTADGFAFDPQTEAWTELDAAPFAGASSAAVWTGSEAIFFATEGGRLGGQAYDPAAGAWRTIADAPIEARRGPVVVWTGSEVIVWGGGQRGDAAASQGAAYDPVNDVWRTIADAPLGLNLASGMWTGQEMIVFGSLLDNRNIAATKASVGAAYDPAADAWRELPPSELSPQATSAVWVGDRMVAWDYEVHSQEYDADVDEWKAPVRMPLDFAECYPNSALVGGRVLAFFCGRAALYDPATGTWEEIHGGLLDEEVDSEAYGRSIKLWRFARLDSSGDTLFMLAEGITLSDNGEACYGCPDSPVSFWAYRSPE